ncbi:hypothetical protein [Methanoregula sp.]|uniref:hypothetical protein n=1 Tax=Methanoregula sp. TaxID=2052170 RepID=UPI002C2F7E3F|nr:hypothetical protein [Methanoregula sp.]HVP97043.1 hypothetical protein [Methanoregula sp.]
MSLDFCTRVTRKIAKIGYPRKVACRIAKFCYLSMTLVCGLFGLFERVKAPIYQITGFGMYAAGTRTGNVSPAFSLILR